MNQSGGASTTFHHIYAVGQGCDVEGAFEGNHLRHHHAAVDVVDGHTLGCLAAGEDGNAVVGRVGIELQRFLVPGIVGLVDVNMCQHLVDGGQCVGLAPAPCVADAVAIVQRACL